MFYFTAFRELQADRALGFGVVGAITYVAIDAWAKRNHVDGDEEFAMLLSLVRVMDDVWREAVMPPADDAPRPGPDKKVTYVKSSRPMTPELFDALMGGVARITE